MSGRCLGWKWGYGRDHGYPSGCQGYLGFVRGIWGLSGGSDGCLRGSGRGMGGVCWVFGGCLMGVRVVLGGVWEECGGCQRGLGVSGWVTIKPFPDPHQILTRHPLDTLKLPPEPQQTPSKNPFRISSVNPQTSPDNCRPP